jgi:hypothetical protein
MKAKNMTMSDAIPVIMKIIKKGDFGNRKHRALELAVSALSKVSTDAATEATLLKREPRKYTRRKNGKSSKEISRIA